MTNLQLYLLGLAKIAHNFAPALIFAVVGLAVLHKRRLI